MGHRNTGFLFYFFSAVLQKFKSEYLKTGLLKREKIPLFTHTRVASTDNPSNKDTAAWTSPLCLQHCHHISAGGTDVAQAYRPCSKYLKSLLEANPIFCSHKLPEGPSLIPLAKWPLAGQPKTDIGKGDGRISAFSPSSFHLNLTNAAI